MAQPVSRLALAAALLTFTGIAVAEARTTAGASAATTCGEPGDARTQQQAGAATVGSGASQSGPDGRGAPGPSGTVPAEPPQAVITLTGRDLKAAPVAEGTLPIACNSPAAPAKLKAIKTRSNIQNN